jgi:hypothetical protein
MQAIELSVSNTPGIRTPIEKTGSPLLNERYSHAGGCANKNAY